MSLWSLLQDNSLVVGAGDNKVHVLDMEHGSFKVGPGFCVRPQTLSLRLDVQLKHVSLGFQMVLEGHSDYVHCVTVREREAEILSGGEDGAVRVWGE